MLMKTHNSKIKQAAHRPVLKDSIAREISSLYTEFQSMKSKIYNSKGNHKSYIMVGDKSNKKNSNFDDQSHLRQNSIRKYSKQFKEQLELINQSKRKHKMFNQKQIKQENQYAESIVHTVPDFSGQLTRHSPKQPNLLEQLLSSELKDQVSNEHQQIYQSFFKNFTPKKISQQYQSNIDYQQLEIFFTKFANHQNSVLIAVNEQIHFMNRRLNCFEQVLNEYLKVIAIDKQRKQTETKNEISLFIDIKSLERRYQAEITELVKYYQAKIHELKFNFKQQLESIQLSKNNQSIEEQRNKLKSMLSQSKKLISTKEEIIESLQEENDQLQRRLLKISADKEDLSLGYSSTTRKFKGEFEKNVAKQPQKSKWQEFQQAEDEVNFNELESVREKSFEEWDISQLQLRQNSNTKSIQGAIKQIYHDSEQHQ